MKVLTTVLSLIAISAISSNSIQRSEKRLIQLNEKQTPVWLNEKQVLDLARNRTHFFDLTEHQNMPKYQLASRAATVIPTNVTYPTLVKSLITKIDKSAMEKFLTSYSSFYNRFFLSEHGEKASHFLLNQVKQNVAGYNGTVSVKLYKHLWPQSSVIARIEGTDLKSEVVVVGAHMDSINSNDPLDGNAPGADDDGSGTTTVLEILRVLAKSNFKPRRTIEFHFYAAEELGLLGSLDIAHTYAANDINVVGMLQLDMTGYNKNNSIRIITDYTDPELTQFLRLLIDNYATYKWFNSRCNSPCSDHASFNIAGYKSAHPVEGIENFRLHTPQDTTEFINYDYVAQFVSIGLGFAIELAESATK